MHYWYRIEWEQSPRGLHLSAVYAETPTPEAPDDQHPWKGPFTSKGERYTVAASHMTHFAVHGH